MWIQRFRGSALEAIVLGTFGFLAASAQTPADQPAHSSCTDSNTLEKRVEFADIGRARHILGHKDPWARQLSEFDMGARQKTTAPTSLEEFLTFASASGVDWTAAEEAAWRAVLEKLSKAAAGLNVHVPNIDLVKTTGREEFGAAYTRQSAIMLPQSMMARPTVDPRRAYFLLAHELFHVLSQADSRLRDEMYALLGFRPLKGFEYPLELESRRLSNPGGGEYLHTLSVQAGSERADVLPVIQSRLPLNEFITLPDIFPALSIVLLSIDTSTGHVRRDSSGNPIMYNFGNTNWVPLMLRNSSYIIHPEELLADNFATLMEWRSEGFLPPTNPSGFPVNDVNLLTAMGDVLIRGCRE